MNLWTRFLDSVLHKEAKNHIAKIEKWNEKQFKIIFLEEGCFSDSDTCLIFCNFLHEDLVKSKK